MNFRTLAYAVALVLDLVGAAAALLIAARPWQSIVTPRPAPLGSDALAISGRTVDSAPTALALVALAGVVAVIATRGWVRRVVGVVLVLAGAALLWRAAVSTSAVSSARARALVTERHRTVDAAAVTPRVSVHLVWPALTIVCAALIVVAGLLVAAHGHRWRALSARYERPDQRVDQRPDQRPGQQGEPAPSAPALWTALDSGVDPTADPVEASEPPARRDTGACGYSQG